MKNSGFTLAEILVTLGVIGVVASMTVPALMQDIQDAQWKTMYKKAFMDASQAWKLALINNQIEKVSMSGPTTIMSINNFNTFKSYFNIIKDCPNTPSNCWASGEIFGNRPVPTAPAFIDSSGRSWTFGDGTWNYIIVDTNGLNSPNKYGKDRFILLCKNSDGGGDQLPIKIGVYLDFPNIHSTWCPSGNCYYISWLK